MSSMTNREFSQKDELFRSCCSEAGVSPTTRQASKFRRRVGKAFSKRASVAARKT